MRLPHTWIHGMLLAFVLAVAPASIGPTFAQPPGEAPAATANRLIVSARLAWNQAQEADGEARQAALEEALDHLHAVLRDHPDSDHAVTLVGGGEVAGISIPMVEDALDALLQPAAEPVAEAAPAPPPAPAAPEPEWRRSSMRVTLEPSRDDPDRGSLGVRLRDLRGDMMDLPSDAGALIISVTTGGAADSAGLRPGDLIVSTDGEPVTSASQLAARAADRAAHTEVAIEFWRFGDAAEDALRIVDAAPLGATEDAAPPDGDDEPSAAPAEPWHLALSVALAREGPARLGVSFLQENELFAAAFGLDHPAGALVETVVEGGRAESAGLQVGDLILRLADRPIEKGTDLLTIVRETPSDVAITAEIVRVGEGLEDLMAHLSRAGAGGDAGALVALAELVRLGIDGAPDRDEAIRLLRRAAGLGSAVAARRLGDLFFAERRGGTSGLDEVTHWYDLAAERGDARASHSLGVLHWNSLYWRGGRAVGDDEEAVRLFRFAAEAGVDDSYTFLGFAYESGRGTATDPAQAALMYRRAIEANGSPVATESLGTLYYHGKGVRQDRAEARQLYERAAAAGNDNPKRWLAWMYRNGEGGPRDEARAMELLRELADDGNGHAIYDLGAWLYDSAADKDRREAVAMFRKASEAGIGDADYMLAVIYSAGRGVARNPRAEGRHMALAVERGSETAISQMKTNARAWSREARVAVQELLRDKGFYRAAIDGAFGPATRRALEAFEASLESR